MAIFKTSTLFQFFQFLSGSMTRTGALEQIKSQNLLDDESDK